MENWRRIEISNRYRTKRLYSSKRNETINQFFDKHLTINNKNGRSAAVRHDVVVESVVGRQTLFPFSIPSTIRAGGT